MKNLRLKTKVARTLRGRSRGVTLIEVLIALALFTIIAIVFISGLTVAARSVFIGDQRTTAESLARAQMEHIKSQPYIDYSDPDRETEDYYPITGYPDNYTIAVDVEPMDPVTGEAHEKISEDTYAKDDGIQKITVIVSRDGSEVFTLEGYNRAKN